MPGPELDCLQTKPRSASSQTEPSLSLWAPSGTGQGGPVSPPPSPAPAPEVLQQHVPRRRRQAEESLWPAPVARLICWKSSRFARFSPARSMPGAGPKPSVSPSAAFPAAPRASSPGSCLSPGCPVARSPDFGPRPDPQVLPVLKHVSGVQPLLLQLMGAHLGGLWGRKGPG